MKAAVLREVNKPLEIEDIQYGNPAPREVLIRTVAAGVCHSDLHFQNGSYPYELPAVLGHESAGVVEAVGSDVTYVKPGDHVIPLYIAECGSCEYCRSDKTNLCQAIAETVWTGYMPDGTRRFSKNGKPIFHYMGCSTFSEFTVVPEIALAKINP